MSQPVCIIIAGPNGAGKTTFALRYLPTSECRRFINADMMASALSPLNPADQTIAAGKLFLKELRGCISARKNFAFETTLSGRGYINLVGDLKASGWIVQLKYLWLASEELCFTRIAERVARGGHDIPAEAIHRRYFKSIFNLLHHYSPICHSTICIDNSGPEGDIIFSQDLSGREVIHPEKYAKLVQEAKTE